VAIEAGPHRGRRPRDDVVPHSRRWRAAGAWKTSRLSGRFLLAVSAGGTVAALVGLSFVVASLFRTAGFGAAAAAGFAAAAAAGLATAVALVESRPVLSRVGDTVDGEEKPSIDAGYCAIARLFDDAPFGFYAADSSGRFVAINQTLARCLDATPTEIIDGAMRLHDFLAPRPPPGTPAWDASSGGRTAVDGVPLEIESRRGRRLSVTIEQAVTGSGSALRAWSIARLRDGERGSDMAAADLPVGPDPRFFADAPVGIAVVDRRGRFVEVNRALGELFGTAPQALIGRELIGLLNQEDRAVIAAKFGAAADRTIDCAPVEVRLEQPRDRAMVLLLSRIDEARAAATSRRGLPDDDAQGELTLYFIDVTERKNLETQFAQSQKMQAVGQLAGGVAHDFNNLLTAMIGFCDLLLLRSRPGDPAFADIMQIKQNANRAANLVRQLLAFSRQQTLQPRVLDITDVLVDLSHLLRRLIGENIVLEVVHGRELGLVKVDQGQLEQVVINLVVNARDAMPQGGRLTIRTANLHQAAALRRGAETMPAGDYVLIEVADTGAGIAPHNLARIFEPFFSTKEVGSGTGLGLSTVYGIVKQTGGFVFVNSTPGEGATFAIYLPRHRAAAGVPAVRTTAAELVVPRDLTGTAAVMLVEDDDAVRMFGARALRNKGYRVTEAKSGEAALELIGGSTEKFELLITDVVMPQMDGPALVREVRLCDPGIKVIFISGYTEDAFRQRLDSDSGIHFLPKPFSLKQLAVKVKEVIGG
jgi:two-component system, cell cycle sensor histidine kinase and response regulator CckA